MVGRPWGHVRGRAVVVLVVVGELELVHRAVVRERRPDPDGRAVPPDQLVHAQHVHERVDRVDRAVRVHRGAALAVVELDAVVGEVGL